MQERKTQQQRREETTQAMLDSACKLFGQKGYPNTSLEDIATDCQLTTRPVYHYFGNKQGLFLAATEYLEQQLADEILEAHRKAPGNFQQNAWHLFLQACQNPVFRQIVLIDSPNILGRERWHQCAVVTAVRQILQPYLPNDALEQELIMRLLLASLAEMAIMIAEADDMNTIASLSQSTVSNLLKSLLQPTASA